MQHIGTPPPIRVIIADDHRWMCNGIALAIEAEPQLHVVGIANCFHTLSDLLGSTRAHVLLLDLEGMGCAPIPMIRKIKQTYASLGIVVVSGEVNYVREALNAGASGYITKKEVEDDHLCLAIRAAKAGQCFVSPLVQEYLDRSPVPTDGSPLTTTELEILRHVAQGLDNHEIAHRMGLVPRTIDNNISSIRAKIGRSTHMKMAAYYRAMYGNPN